MDSEPIVVISTISSLKEAECIAEVILAESLAACVNILPRCTSLYRWEGKMCRDQEHMLFIKTRQVRYAELEARLKALHSYELPEIIAVSIQAGLPEYLSWIDKHTG